jgi:hypothetical protein
MAFTKIAAAGIGSTGTVTLQNVVVTGTLNVPSITGAASTANVRSDSLVVSGVSTLGVTTLTTLTVTGNAGFTTTSHLTVPKGTSAQRPGTPVSGMIRYNTENQQFEGYAAAWGGFGGASGASGNAVFYENDTSVTASYQITSGKNAMSAGPITLNAGVVVTIPSGSVWTVV